LDTSCISKKSIISTSVNSHKTVSGSATKLVIGTFSYTYVQSKKHHFYNSANAAILNFANNPGATSLFLKRAIKFSTQELMLSMNLEEF